MKKLSKLNLASYDTRAREMVDWEADIDTHKKFLRLTHENRGLFFALLGKENDVDSYATSPVYYALTGRKGLWIYQDGNSYIPLCWHPNVDGQVLVFPPRGETSSKILGRLLNEIPVPPNGIRLARIKNAVSDQTWLKNITGNEDRSFKVIPVEELVLDWRFPVRILSTKTVSEMVGGYYLRTRNHIKQLKSKSVVIDQLSQIDKKQVLDFVYRWANRRTNDVNDLINLITPYYECLELLDDELFNLDGFTISIDGSIQALAMWEYPNTSANIANAWINLSNTSYKGLSEFVMNTTAKCLYSKGITRINYGGSETKGLDDYKKKFVPTNSIELKSAEIVIEGEDFILGSLIKLHEMRAAI